MADPITQAVTETAQTAATGGAGGIAGAVISFFAATKIFAKREELLDLVKKEDMNASIAQCRLDVANMRADFAEKYISKEMVKDLLQPIMDELHRIRERVEEIGDSQSHT